MARPRKNPITIDKTCPTCKKTFTISSRKYRQIFCSKTCAQHNPSVLEKMEKSKQKTYDEKYGGLHPMQTKQTVDNFKKSLFENHGKDYFTNYLVKKSKETNLQKYGDENYNNKEKSKQTCLKRYGVENFVYTDEYKEKSKQTCLNKYGVEFPSQSKPYKEKLKNTIFERFLTTGRFDNFTPLFDIKTYNGVLNKQKYIFKCDRCNQNIICYLHAGKYPICFNCDKDNASFYQKEIFNFLKEELGNDEIILTNERSILYPFEINIYIQSLKLGIEFNGLFWHSELGGSKNKTYHLNKLNKCLFKEIKLIHIFEDDWVNKKEIVKSILRNHMNKTKFTMYARNCTISELITVNDFLENNHIQGNDKNNIKLGLFFNKELVSIMTFCKSRFDRNIEYEMSRFCNKLNTSIIGGASKLFTYFINNYHPKSVVTYADRKYFNGNVYNKLGFSFISNTPPSYKYINRDGYKFQLNRLPFQKHKLKDLLENFNENLSEWENMKNNGFDRIWDCGHSKWVIRFNYPTDDLKNNPSPLDSI